MDRLATLMSSFRALWQDLDEAVVAPQQSPLPQAQRRPIVLGEVPRGPCCPLPDAGSSAQRTGHPHPPRGLVQGGRGGMGDQGVGPQGDPGHQGGPGAGEGASGGQPASQSAEPASQVQETITHPKPMENH